MMSLIKRIWQKYAPAALLTYIRFLFESKKNKSYRKEVLKQYKNQDLNTIDPVIREGLKYLRVHKFSAFPYRWAMKYDNFQPTIYHDKQNQCSYVLYEGKKMYFPKKLTQTEIIWLTRSSYKEQDPQSPHLYQTTDFQVEQNSIVVDAGVAEGNFALSVIEKAKLLYLIECDTEWMEALRLTFEPWKEKVIFIEKLLSDTKSDSTISIDSILKPIPTEKYFIKMDIEGYEKEALKGIKNLVESKSDIKLDICTYHHTNDLHDIGAILDQWEFRWNVSPSYMLFCQQEDNPTFRKVLIRAQKP